VSGEGLITAAANADSSDDKSGSSTAIATIVPPSAETLSEARAIATAEVSSVCINHY
jgi:hypothetical protein